MFNMLDTDSPAFNAVFYGVGLLVSMVALFFMLRRRRRRRIEQLQVEASLNEQAEVEEKAIEDAIRQLPKRIYSRSGVPAHCGGMTPPRTPSSVAMEEAGASVAMQEGGIEMSDLSGRGGAGGGSSSVGALGRTPRGKQRQSADVASTSSQGISSSTLAECAVCLADFEEGDTLRELPCGHVFHLECCDKWLLGSGTRGPGGGEAEQTIAERANNCTLLQQKPLPSCPLCKTIALGSLDL